MAKEKDTESKLAIYKTDGYKNHSVLISRFGFKKEEEQKFNSGEKLEVTEEQLETIGKHRWLGVSNA